MTVRVVVLASGRGSNMESLAARITDGLVDAEIVAVISDNPDAPCLETAANLGIHVVPLPPNEGDSRLEYDGRLVAAINEHTPDLVVLAGFMRILSPACCDAFVGRMINIHPALLPSFKGAHGVRDTLRAGARLAGCTTHFVTSQLDGGPLIMQAALAIAPGESEEGLAARVLAVEHQLLPRTVQLFAEGRLTLEEDIVQIGAGVSWSDRLNQIPGVLYASGY